MTRSTVLTASLAALAAAMSFAAANFSPHTDDECPEVHPTSLVLPSDPRVADLAARSGAKDEVAREVLAGRMTLPEAAARFTLLNALPPRAVVPPSDTLVMTAGLPDPGDCTEAERAAVQVVVRAAVVVQRDASHAGARGARERMWRQFLADRSAGRLVRLPDVPDGDVDELLGLAGDRLVDVENWE